jgi:putative endonuclease
MGREHAYFVYILASKRNGTLYVGVTGDLYGRIVEHRDGLIPGFTKRYGVKTLVYFESTMTSIKRSCARSGSSAGEETGKSN